MTKVSPIVGAGGHGGLTTALEPYQHRFLLLRFTQYRVLEGGQAVGTTITTVTPEGNACCLRFEIRWVPHGGFTAGWWACSSPV